MESYWVVFKETAERGRRISWLIDGHEMISEEEGPIAHNCPLFILDMVPEVKNLEWRNAVKQHWRLATKIGKVQLELTQSHGINVCTHISIANDGGTEKVG